MFALIITIISIALVCALALATIYYGGSAFAGPLERGADARARKRALYRMHPLARHTRGAY